MMRFLWMVCKMVEYWQDLRIYTNNERWRATKIDGPISPFEGVPTKENM